MKIRNNSRILALVLALVMILPLISIPVFANETDAPAAPEFSENFESTDVVLSDIVSTSLSAVVIKDAADTAHGKVMEVSATPTGAAPYYLMASNQKSAWPIDGTVTDGKISGTANNLTFENLDVPTTDLTAVKVNIGGTDYYIGTGAYADAKAGFIGGAFGNPLNFKNPAFSNDAGHATIQTDFFVSEDFLSAGGFAGRIGATKVDGGAGVSVELFKITRSANGEAILGPHGNAKTIKGITPNLPRNTWVSLIFDINLANGEVDVLLNGEFAFRTVNDGSGKYALINAPISITANSFSMENSRGRTPDLCGGYVQFDNIVIKSGACGITYNPDALKPLYIDFEDSTLDAALDSSIFANNAMKNVTVVEAFGEKAMKVPFKSVYNMNDSHPDDLNKDQCFQLKNSKIACDLHDKIVIEATYFIEPETNGQIQLQLNLGSGVSATNAETGEAVSPQWVDVYQFSFRDGAGKIFSENDGAFSAPVTLGVWNTISAVIDLDTGMREVYINGVLAWSLQLYKKVNLANISISPNTLVFGKVNKVADSEGAYYVKNISVFEGNAPSVEPAPEKTVNDFEEFIYCVDNAISALSAPKLATYKKVEDNIVVNLPIAGTKEEGKYVLLREDGRNIEAAGGVTFSDTFEEDGTVTAKLSDDDEWELVLQPSYFYEGFYEAWAKDFRTEELYPLTDHEINSSKDKDENYLSYYLVDANVADLAVGTGGQFGRGAKIAHNKYTYVDTDILVLSADYFIEPGSKGVIEAQFEDYYYDTVEGEGDEAVVTSNQASWIQLYYFDLATGKVEGTDDRMNIGEWNNIKYFLNLKTGEGEIYLNGALIASENVGRTNLSVGVNAASTFSFAKIQRTTSLTGEVAGSIMVDNLYVGTDVPADSQYGDGYLSDEAYLNNLSNILVTVKDPSFRFEDANGIRFATTINEEFLAGVLANLGEDAIVGMGTLIAPLDYVELAGAFTKEALAAIEVETAKYLDIPFEQFFEGAKGVDFGDAKAFTASIVDIKEANLMRDFAAVGYVTVKLPDGTERTYYAKSYATSNIVYEAKATLAPAAPYDYTEEEFAALTAFAEADVEDLIWVDVPYGSYNSPEFGEPSMNVEIEGRTFYSFWGEFATLTVTGPEGFKLYYNGEFIDSVDGKVVLENVAGDPEIGAIIIGLVDAGAYSVEGVAPLGTMENPVVIESLEDVVNVKVPENGLVYYQLVAGSTGYIVVTTESELASLYVYTENVQMNTLEGAGSVKIPVMTGETVMIQVSTVMDELTHTSPAGDVAFALATEAAASVTGPEMSVELAAGEWYILTGRAMQLAGMYLNIADTNLYYVIVNGEWYFDDEGVGHSILLAGDDFNMVTILFKNNTEEAFTVDLAFSATPLSADGEKIIAGEFGNGTPIALGEGSAVSYGEGHLSWTAEAAGTFTFEITSTENWAMNITNQNSKQSDTFTAMGDIAVITFEVAAGDVLDIMVGALDFNTVEFTFVASFAAAE